MWHQSPAHGEEICINSSNNEMAAICMIFAVTNVQLTMTPVRYVALSCLKFADDLMPHSQKQLPKSHLDDLPESMPVFSKH